MARPNKPLDQVVVNGWYLELPGLPDSMHFETLSGLQVSGNDVELVDAGTNLKHKFPSQILDFGELSLSRTYDASDRDKAIEALVDECLTTGLTVNAIAVKLHWREELFRIVLEGFRFKGKSLPNFEVGGEGKFTVTYSAVIEQWYFL